jgi:hypothetical protein
MQKWLGQDKFLSALPRPPAGPHARKKVVAFCIDRCGAARRAELIPSDCGSYRDPTFCVMRPLVRFNQEVTKTVSAQWSDGRRSGSDPTFQLPRSANKQAPPTSRSLVGAALARCWKQNHQTQIEQLGDLQQGRPFITAGISIGLSWRSERSLQLRPCF